MKYLLTAYPKNADDAHIRTQVHVRDLSDRFLAEVNVLPDHGHAPCCHAPQEQKE